MTDKDVKMQMMLKNVLVIFFYNFKLQYKNAYIILITGDQINGEIIKFDLEKNYFLIVRENDVKKKEIEIELKDISVIEIKNIFSPSDRIDRNNDNNMEIGKES